MTTVLFWDIDGTLLHSGGAGKFALADAARELTNISTDLSDIEMAGKTDWAIATQILNRLHLNPTQETIDTLLNLYLNYLPTRLALTPGYVLAGVKEILDSLAPRQDVVSYLLTGNGEAGAWQKLEHYGLDSYFNEGAFCQDSSDRGDIARQALNLAQAQLGTVSPEKCYVIGDTPYDIRCGQLIGARTIAIASERYSTDELKSYNSWWVCETFPQPQTFMQKVGLI